MISKGSPFYLRIGQLTAIDSQGSAAIEFALIAPVFFLIFMGIFELGAIMVVQTSLETAILQVSRYGRTGNTVEGQSNAATALSLASTYSFGLVDPNNLVLTVTPYPSFSAIPPLSQAPNTGSQNFGTGDQPVLYTLSYNWVFFTPFADTLLSATGNSIKITSSAVIQNEPT